DAMRCDAMRCDAMRCDAMRSAIGMGGLAWQHGDKSFDADHQPPAWADRAVARAAGLRPSVKDAFRFHPGAGCGHGRAGSATTGGKP
ncbi:hypothetical protein, partial [Chromobacterium violaceum]|uniref:hypothetical protein n=1 Tax=Chromobacterium violaceum TaxID=536 RepID=UPI001A97BF47